MRIAMIGIKAIPAHFGGFETAVDEVSRRLVKMGHEVLVYNRRGMSSHPESTYDGVQLITLPTLRSKNLSTIVHALLSTLHVLFQRVDVVHYFTTGATLFAPLVRLTGKKVVCSVDGTDWQRNKWGRFAKSYLRLSERFAVWFCHALVSDSRDVMRYYVDNYRAPSTCITYGVREYRSESDDVLTRFGIRERHYVLFVGRLVPENNVHVLIEAFEKTATAHNLVIVGDDPWERHYVQSLKSTRDPRIVFTGGVYGDGYAQLQQNAYLFVLPDEVGGTHPALVEAMGFGNCVLVNDTASNVEVIGENGFCYSGSVGCESLRSALQRLLDAPDLAEEYRKKAQRHACESYRWEDIVSQHVLLYQHIVSGDGKRQASQPARPAEL